MTAGLADSLAAKERKNSRTERQITSIAWKVEAYGVVDERHFIGLTVSAVHPSTTSYSEEKLQQAILYFLEHINNVHLGRTKLMKLLYFVDFDHYEAHGQSVTGAIYRKLPHGPYPDKVEKLIAKMEKAGL